MTVLCGGKSMMLAPLTPYDIDLLHSADVLGHCVLRSSEEMLEFMYEDIKLTLYRNGNLMFYHYTDIEHGYKIADMVLGMLTT